MSIGTLPPSLPSRHASLPSPFSLLPTPISPRVETSHHVVTSARDSAPIVAPSPVTTPDAMMSLTAIEHLDFEPEVPCEHSHHESGEYGHSGPGWALVATRCPKCGDGATYVCCRGWWDYSSTGVLTCPNCCAMGRRDDLVRIVQVLR